MIIRKRLHWFQMLFVWHGSVLPRILPQLLLATATACVVLLLHGTLWHFKVTLTAVPFSLTGIALSIFLGFRNNASYERFWEGRKLWGALLIDSRSLTRQVLTLYQGPRDNARSFVYMLIAFTHALRHQLRDSDANADIDNLLPAAWQQRVRKARYKPAIILLALGEWLKSARQSGEISDILAHSIDQKLGGLTDVLGGCERIASTPIPFSYSVLLHRTVFLYCFLLPFGLIDSIGVMTPVVVAFVSYTFFALDAISEEIEAPFGLMPNALALDALNRMIESSLREMLGETPLDDIAPPDNYILL